MHCYIYTCSCEISRPYYNATTYVATSMKEKLQVVYVQKLDMNDNVFHES